MTVRMTTIDDIDALDALFARSAEEPVLLLNHDPWCPISARALAEVRLLDEQVAVVDVSRDHALTREIERRTHVRHESPQLFILLAGQANWSASHLAVTASATAAALALARQGASSAAANLSAATRADSRTDSGDVWNPT